MQKVEGGEQAMLEEEEAERGSATLLRGPKPACSTSCACDVARVRCANALTLEQRRKSTYALVKQAHREIVLKRQIPYCRPTF